MPTMAPLVFGLARPSRLGLQEAVLTWDFVSPLSANLTRAPRARAILRKKDF
jgi:hypothetical protein